MVISFQRKTPQITPVNIQGLDIEMVAKYKYLCVHHKLDWTDNTDALYKKCQSRLHLLRRLRSFGGERILPTLHTLTFYDTVVAVAPLSSDRKRLNKLVRKARYVLDCPLDFIEVVGERQMFN